MTWTPEQIRKCALSKTLSVEEGNRLCDELIAEMGEESFEELCLSPELEYADKQLELAREAKATLANVAAREAKRAKRKMKPFKRARRVSRSPETWRHLKNYPGYEISSHGRVRSLDRARPDDWLKPRRKWFRGMSVDFVVVYDTKNKRRERLVGYLLVDAGFLPRPAWMKS